MSKAQKKLEKRRNKEKENHKKILARRSHIRKEAKIEREEFRQEKKHRKMLREIEEMKTFYDKMKDKLPEDTRKQLERNIEILQSLEDEYNREVEQRNQNNQELEEAGAKTLKDKLDLLEKKLLAEPGKMITEPETKVSTIPNLIQQAILPKSEENQEN